MEQTSELPEPTARPHIWHLLGKLKKLNGFQVPRQPISYKLCVKEWAAPIDIVPVDWTKPLLPSDKFREDSDNCPTLRTAKG